MIPEAKAETNPDESSVEKYVADKLWAIRPCFIYKEEYDECTGIRGRFHQYFIHGESTDCASWKRDYDNCIKFEETKNAQHAKVIIESEANRRHERLKAHYANDTWTRRKAPPEDWAKPLPERLQKRNENTYLEIKAKELQQDGQFSESRTLCVIM